MPTASGVNKLLAIKKETTWGTLAGASGAQFLRRKSSTLDEVRESYGSDEINPSQQRRIYAHGPRKAQGQIVGDLSGGTYQMLVQSHLRRDFTTVSAMSSLSLTIAGSGPTYTVTRASGSFLTDGVKVGMVVRITAGAVNANNSQKNLFVVGVVALTLTVIPWGNGTLTAEGPIASCTISVPGKVTFIPSSSQTNDSYTIEHRFVDNGQYEVFTGCRVAGLSINAQPSGLLEATFDLLGKGFGQAPGSSPYFTSPTASTTSSGFASVNGALRTAGGQQSTVTSLQVRSDGGMSTLPVVGSNYSPDVFVGPFTVNGQMTALFDSATMRDAFYNESLVALNLVAYATTAANSEFVCVTLPAIKLNGNQKTDGAGPVVMTMPFEALENTAGGAGTDSEATTLWVQDSLAT